MPLTQATPVRLYENSTPGAYTFTAPVSGMYRIHIVGGGSAANTGGFGGIGGTVVEAFHQLAAGETVTGTIGTGGTYSGGNGTSTTATTPRGALTTAAGGTGQQGTAYLAGTVGTIFGQTYAGNSQAAGAPHNAGGNGSGGGWTNATTGGNGCPGYVRIEW